LAERWRAGKARGGERRGGEYLWRLIFPPRCLTCAVLLPAGAEAPLCRSCLSSFIPAGPLCPRCGELLPPAAPCSCIPESAPLRGLFALSWYEGAWRQMLHRFKFRGKRSLARPLGSWLGRLIREETCWEPAFVIPVPLHRRRLRERGYDQAQLLARFAATALGVPLRPLLARIRPTAAQSSLSHHQRQENVRGVFACRRAALPGKRALLVDDIYSTGATMQEAAAVLQKQGLVVFGAVAAFTQRPS
jgi:ComF family protein